MKRKKVNFSDLSEVLLDLTGYKRKAISIMHLFEGSEDPVLLHRAERMFGCGTILTIGDDGDRFALTGANFCRQRLCPMCQYRRAVRMGEVAREHCADLITQGYAFLHLVLTVRNVHGDDLRRTLDRMNRSFSKMLKDARLIGWKGALRCTEVTYNAKNGDYHPHFHVLVAVRKSYFKSRFYVKKDAIIELWRQYAKLDYDPSVHIGVADDYAIGEICKYCVKPFTQENLPRDELLCVYQTYDIQLGGRRLLQCYGVMKNAMSQQLHDADELAEDNSNTIDLVGSFVYNYNTGLYESSE